MRATITLPSWANEKDTQNAALAESNVQSAIAGKSIKIIVVPGRIEMLLRLSLFFTLVALSACGFTPLYESQKTIRLDYFHKLISPLSRTKAAYLRNL